MGDFDPIDRPTTAERAALERYMSQIFRNTRPGNGQSWEEYVDSRTDAALIEAFRDVFSMEAAASRGKFKSRPGPVKPFEEV
jgi:hypothetical protein